MQHRHPVLVPFLAFAVSLASFSCACASPASGPATGSGIHAGHHDSAAPPDVDCADAGCGGNGDFAAVLPERASLFVESLEVPPDDDAQALPALAIAAASPNMAPLGPPPPPARRRTSDTPVTRFDKLLN